MLVISDLSEFCAVNMYYENHYQMLPACVGIL